MTYWAGKLFDVTAGIVWRLAGRRVEAISGPNSRSSLVVSRRLPQSPNIVAERILP
jgi:hypothetical protein